MIRHATLVAGALALTGCASVINDVTHPMKVETKTEAGPWWPARSAS